MRISDWSSDVCSSDLNQQTFLVTVTPLRDHLTLVVDSTDKLGRAVSQNTGEKTSALEVTERLREAAAKGQAAGSPSKEDHSKKPPELVKERRSEEHTSELQSLMRISYAVFCLKKKMIKTKLVRKTAQ